MGMSENVGIKKIVSLGSSALEDDLRYSDVEADLFVYAYNYSSYEGNGFACWRNDKKWSYDYLSHCSCNGPTDGLRAASNMKISLEDVIRIAEREASPESQEVAAYLRKLEY